MCHMGCETFKCRLALSVAELILLLCSTGKGTIANVMKCTAHLKAILKCVCATMHSLVMSPFSCDLIKNASTLIKVFTVFNY